MRYGLIANRRKKVFWQKLPDLLSWFRQRKVDIVLSREIVNDARFPLKKDTFPVAPEAEVAVTTEMVLAIGGDGNILHALQLIGEKATPVLGINAGGLGFLTEIPLDHFTEAFGKIHEGAYRVEKRIILKGSIKDDPLPMYALNEFIIDKAASVRVIQIIIEIDGHFLNTYVADGLLISTPTGSTGYSLSSGGPIIVPNIDVVVINPICPHSLTSRPIIIPATSSIRAIVRTEHDCFQVAADGRDIRPYTTRTEVKIKKADFPANLVKPLGSSFYQLLHNKLNWSKDFRDFQRWSHDS